MNLKIKINIKFKIMATNGQNGVKHSYALPESHKDVSMVRIGRFQLIDLFLQMLEKSLLESDPEIAEIMVILFPSRFGNSVSNGLF